MCLVLTLKILLSSEGNSLHKDKVELKDGEKGQMAAWIQKQTKKKEGKKVVKDTQTHLRDL